MKPGFSHRAETPELTFRQIPSPRIIPSRPQETGRDATVNTPRTISMPLLAVTDDAVYRCPGEQHAVSRAVHLGRLASGYAACEQCVWKFASSASTDQAVSTTDTRPQIRRTTYGVRGQYINAVSRSIASRLATIIATHLRQQVPDHPLTVATGFTGHRGGPDIFAGVVSAVLQAGCNVIDVGRCTAASLHHCLRTDDAAKYGILVTGAGAAPHDIGLDVICDDGRPIAIPWADHGLSATTLNQAPADEATTVLQLDRGGQTSGHADFSPRPGRCSGQLSTTVSEDNYRRWLAAWWPSQDERSMTMIVPRDYSAQRIAWLTDITDCHITQAASGESASPDSPGGMFTIRIHDDDRFMTATSASGRRISADALASWINTARRTHVQHITAHVSTLENQIRLCDVAAPNSADAQNTICDALAISGLITTLSQHNPLPTR